MMRFFDAPLLKLYLARDGGAWLNRNDDDDIKALKRREVPDRIKNLMQEQLMLVETRKLNHDAYFGKNFRPAEEDVHVLVELPEDPKEVLHYKRSGSTDCEFSPLQSLQSALRWLFGTEQTLQTKKSV